MNSKTKKTIVAAIQAIGLFVVVLVGMMGTTSCKKPCQVQDITWHFNFSLKNECVACPNPDYSKLIVQRNNQAHYNGSFPIPGGSTINFIANRSGGQVVTGTYVRICAGRVMVCTGSVVTPNLTNDCEKGSFTMSVPLNCVC